MRPIDADALKSYLNNNEYADMYYIEALFGIIDRQPAIDPEARARGKWIPYKICNHKPCRIKQPDKWTIFRCSVCDYSNGRRKNSNYCPSCGAKMEV